MDTNNNYIRPRSDRCHRMDRMDWIYGLHRTNRSHRSCRSPHVSLSWQCSELFGYIR